jgi:hypothetical protein
MTILCLRNSYQNSRVCSRFLVNFEPVVGSTRYFCVSDHTWVMSESYVISYLAIYLFMLIFFDIRMPGVNSLFVSTWCAHFELTKAPFIEDMRSWNFELRCLITAWSAHFYPYIILHGDDTFLTFWLLDRPSWFDMVTVSLGFELEVGRFCLYVPCQHNGGHETQISRENWTVHTFCFKTRKLYY